jgi:dolichol-phosphate mannosyltransferase
MRKYLKTKNIIVIPIFNEQRHIFKVLQKVRKFSQDDLLFINDGSTDLSQNIIEKFAYSPKTLGHIYVLRHLKNQGYGQSLIDGIRYAQLHHYQYITTMDADEQHEPKFIPQFLNEIKKGNADIISGSRYISPYNKYDNPPVDRLKINQQITQLINHITGYGLTDSFCGFKSYNLKSLKKLELSEKGYGFPLQLWIQACKNHLKVKEIAINMIYLDKNRTFGGRLDNPEIRLKYYMEVIHREVEKCSIY